MKAPVSATVLTLPEAPAAYEKKDQDRVRRLLEDALQAISSGLNILGSESVTPEELKRFIEVRTRFRGVNDGDVLSMSELLAETRFVPFGAAAYTNSVWVAATATTENLIFKKVDDRHCMMFKPGTAIDAPSARLMHFRPHAIGATFPARIEFRESFGNITAPSVDTSVVPLPLSCSIQAWFRKETSGDTSHARFTFGFCDMQVVFPSAERSRIGLIGDGAGGYRFGSVHCPDGAASGNTTATAIDANSVQPAGLVSPGTNWWHARIKIVPPTPTQSGRWGAYLNGILQATFATNTNFPRGSLATSHNYSSIEAAVMYYSDTTQLPGVLVDDLRVTFDEIYAL